MRSFTAHPDHPWLFAPLGAKTTAWALIAPMRADASRLTKTEFQRLLETADAPAMGRISYAALRSAVDKAERSVWPQIMICGCSIDSAILLKLFAVLPSPASMRFDIGTHEFPITEPANCAGMQTIVFFRCAEYVAVVAPLLIHQLVLDDLDAGESQNGHSE